MEIDKHIRQLLDKYREDSITRVEYQELLHYFDIDSEAENSYQLLHAVISESSDLDYIPQGRVDKITTNVHIQLQHRIRAQQRNHWRNFLPYVAAVFIFCIGAYFYFDQRIDKSQRAEVVGQFGQDLPAGTNRALMVLSDGREIVLDGEHDGVRVGEDGVMYTNGDEIYTSERVEYLTIKTPSAGQYRLILPDSSIVWLNAVSSLTYPTKFGKGQRLVKLEGEAYFDIAKDKSKPFIVQNRTQQIIVTGTKFNVSSYTDEPIVTTLVEGKVSVAMSGSGRRTTLSPGQQAVTTAGKIEVRSVDPNVFIAWKEGYFVFEQTELPVILRQLARWYDVEIDYTGVPNKTLSARIRRDKNISSVLHAISKTSELNFYIKERRMMLRK